MVLVSKRMWVVKIVRANGDVDGSSLFETEVR